MNETPLLFGSRQSLVGVLSQPESPVPGGCAILMFNAGVLSRIGPHRLNVKLARALAERGQTSLRFDLSGRGDSRSDLTGGDAQDTAVRDICTAMDLLDESYGIRQFVLIGYCSGAVDAFAAAVRDARVVAILMFDGYWYRTRWTRLVRNWKRFQSNSLLHVAAALWRAGRRAVSMDRPKANDAVDIPVSDNLPKREFIRLTQSLVDRGVSMLFMYSGSVIDYYSYASQFRHAFGREAFFSKVCCQYHPEIDHTFITLQAQQRFIEWVLEWIQDPRFANRVPG